MRDRFFPMMQQASESTASFIIHMEQEYIYKGLGVTTTYYAFVSRLDNNIPSLLDNIQVNKRANGGGSFTWQMW